MAKWDADKLRAEIARVFPTPENFGKKVQLYTQADLDAAVAAQRERDAKVAETHPMRFAGQTEDDVRAAIAAAIRAHEKGGDG